MEKIVNKIKNCYVCFILILIPCYVVCGYLYNRAYGQGDIEDLRRIIYSIKPVNNYRILNEQLWSGSKIQIVKTYYVLLEPLNPYSENSLDIFREYFKNNNWHIEEDRQSNLTISNKCYVITLHAHSKGCSMIVEHNTIFRKLRL